MRRNWIWAAIALLVLAAGGGWYFGSPAWTLKQMATAAQAHNADKLSVYIDYPKLRDSTKSQIKAAMSAKIAAGSSNGLEAVGMMIGLGMVDNMVDGILSPDGMTAMFAMDKAKQANGQAAKKPMGLDAANREIVRDGFDRFRLHEKGKPGQDGDLIFERNGLGWKLVQIKVPAGLFNDKR